MDKTDTLTEIVGKVCANELVEVSKERGVALPVVVLDGAATEERFVVSPALAVLGSNTKVNAVGGIFEDTLEVEAVPARSDRLNEGWGRLIS